MGEQQQPSWPRTLIICVIAGWIWVAGGQDVSVEEVEGTEDLLSCNGTSCDKSPGYKTENSAPPGINDKTHYNDPNNSHHDPFKRGGPYWLVPPFLIGASAVIIVYIIGHCLYLHCYATKKMRRLAERQYPPTIVISDEPTSTASYKTFTPIVRYNEQGEVIEGQSFVFYQPFDDDEWERQLELRRCSSVRSSFRGSFRSSSRRSSSRKKSISLQLPKLFGGKRPSVSSSISTGDQEPSPSSPRPPRVCFVPVGRSLSVPAASDNKQQPPSPSQGYLFSPVVLARTQSCRSARKPSIPKAPKLNGSASDGELLPQTPLPQAPMIIIGSGEAFQQSATGGATAASPNEASPSGATDATASTCPVSTSATKPEVTQKDKMEAQVVFQVGDAGEESEVLLCDIKEEHEDN